MRDLNLCEIRAATALHMSIKRASTQRGKKSPVQCDIRLYLSRKQRRHTTCGVIWFKVQDTFEMSTLQTHPVVTAAGYTAAARGCHPHAAT
jgi:hypothetical protein